MDRGSSAAAFKTASGAKPVVAIHLACEKLCEDFAANRLVAMSGLTAAKYATLLRQARRDLGLAHSLTMEQLAVQFGSVQLVRPSRWLLDIFLSRYQPRLSAAQLQNFSPDAPVMLGVSFYLCCKASGVRIDKGKIVLRCETSAKEFNQFTAHMKELVADELKQLGIGQSTPRKRGPAATTLTQRAPQTVAHPGRTVDILNDIVDVPAYRSVPSSPTLERRPQGVKRKASEQMDTPEASLVPRPIALPTPRSRTGPGRRPRPPLAQVANRCTTGVESSGSPAVSSPGPQPKRKRTTGPAVVNLDLDPDSSQSPMILPAPLPCVASPPKGQATMSESPINPFDGAAQPAAALSKTTGPAAAAVTGITAMIPNADYRRSKTYRSYIAWKKRIEERLPPTT
ncbi:Origin of replication complex subunit 6 [Tieghemiomyces parasiticus]|uniref:Origin of replication complex subunit 6 n=1 Tax=Tieghemiomyces parasiticus TaxID=78921 RepID=A0A9W7ZMD9_9FUNG|nr:Origin of replication complex subunit 6 [Tieghemiomyces parasiticus]